MQWQAAALVEVTNIWSRTVLPAGKTAHLQNWCCQWLSRIISSWQFEKMLHIWQRNSLMNNNLYLNAGHNPHELQVFSSKAMNCAVLESACSSTVCDRQWLEEYIDSLADNQLEYTKSFESDKVFRFNGGTWLISKGQYEFPATPGQKVKIKTDVSLCIPLLPSKTIMERPIWNPI